MRDDLVAVLRKHQHLRADEMLALAAHMVGQIIALQDQRKFTREMALEIVIKNIEAGNAEAMAQVASAGGVAQ